MRLTTLYLDATAEAVSHMSAPVPEVQPGQPAPHAVAAALAAAEAAWDAFELAAFPTLTRRTTAALTAPRTTADAAAWDAFERATFPALNR